MIPVLAVIVACQLFVIVGGTVMYLRRHKVPQIASESAPIDLEPLWEVARAHAGEIDSIREEVAALTIALAEGISHVDRAERRVRSTVQRAQRRLQDAGIYDDRVEAEAADLPGGDGEGSQQIGLPNLPTPVAEAADPRADPHLVIPGKF